MPAPIIAVLKDRRIITDETLEFVLQRPTGFEFQAGQNVNLKLSELKYDDARQGRRSLTIASSPHENDLVFATRLTGSGFKNTILNGPLQDIEINGPRGNMLHDRTKPAVFIAGGIGVTPFKSMVLAALQGNAFLPITFLYSNKTLTDAAYHDLFVDMSEKHKDRFVYVPTLTRQDSDAEWQGERGRIDAHFIRKYVRDFSAVNFYVCGPPQMVDAVVEILKNESVIEENILSESFWGYK